MPGSLLIATLLSINSLVPILIGCGLTEINHSKNNKVLEYLAIVKVFLSLSNSFFTLPELHNKT